jgi:hypothetical protein
MWSRNFLSFRNILVVGQLRNFVVSHGLFLKIQGGRDRNQDQGNIPFFFILKYFVINEEKSQISYITMYGISHHKNDTQSANPYS